jgi:mannose-1-phosphate guanylyltransferase
MPMLRTALILAGGDGKRLSDLTREISGESIPKQYCPLLNGSSLLEATISRVQLLMPFEQIHVVINQNHIKWANEQLHAIPEANIFVQPLNRDTGPGIVFSLLRLSQSYPDSIVAVFPSDHFIDNDRVFITHVEEAAHVVSHAPEKIVLLGVAPDRLENGYGYILPAEALKTLGSASSLFQVEAFSEKPDMATAGRLISRGGLWNTFVMVFRLHRMLQLLRELAPDESRKLFELRDHPDRASELYRALLPWNFSIRILARIPQHLVTLKVVGVHWNDLGTREAVERTLEWLDLKPGRHLPNSMMKAIPRKRKNEETLKDSDAAFERPAAQYSASS